ncbi:hypothetical protein I7I48_07897 [Histoplasma ohiense]|nr:hypothetical protein I7I48_07897 [Histoplasma ohiense (nom. inval.)]
MWEMMDNSLQNQLYQAAKPRIQMEEGEASLESWDTLAIQYNYCICILEGIVSAIVSGGV